MLFGLCHTEHNTLLPSRICTSNNRVEIFRGLRWQDFLKLFIRFLTFYDYANQTSITLVKKDSLYLRLHQCSYYLFAHLWFIRFTSELMCSLGFKVWVSFLKLIYDCSKLHLVLNIISVVSSSLFFTFYYNIMLKCNYWIIVMWFQINYQINSIQILYKAFWSRWIIEEYYWL